jgi:hypothetical protein
MRGTFGIFMHSTQPNSRRALSMSSASRAVRDVEFSMKVRFWRKAAVRKLSTSVKCQQETHAPQQTAPSFDRLVGAAEQPERDSQAEDLGSLQVSECKALTAASRLSTGTNKFTECDDKTYLSAIIP